jgi:hypothetical protein
MPVTATNGASVATNVVINVIQGVQVGTQAFLSPITVPPVVAGANAGRVIYSDAGQLASGRYRR